jgi:hypothetical protein
MKAQIIKKLMEIEASEGIRILFACESGSRGWGFPSIDSDYDVRFFLCAKNGGLHPLVSARYRNAISNNR